MTVKLIGCYYKFVRFLKYTLISNSHEKYDLNKIHDKTMKYGPEFKVNKYIKVLLRSLNDLQRVILLDVPLFQMDQE